MNKKLLSILIAVVMVCTLFSGCSLFQSQEEEQSPPPEKVAISIDSNKSPTLNVGDTYKLLYTCAETVTITCNGKFNYKTNIFTAEKAGKFEIKLKAGSGETLNEVTVPVTVNGEGDKSELVALVNSVSDYIESDYYESGYNALTQALIESNAVINKKNATQAQIDGTLASLKAACENLRPKAFADKKAEVTDDYVLYNGNYYRKSYYTNFADVCAKIKSVNTDGSIKLHSVYDGQINTELKKLKGIEGKELANMNLQRGTEMALKVFNDYYASSPEGLDILTKGTGAIIYDVLNASGGHIKNEGTGNKETDFWTLTAILSLMVRLDTDTAESHKAEVDKVIDAMAYHRGTRSDNALNREFHVYGVHRSRNKDKMDVVGYLGRESVFDDQIWAAQEFLNAYNLYKDTKYLDVAKELTEYIYLIGRCERGGIYWGQGYTTRHACSSAPFVKLAVMLSEATNNSEYLNWAKDVYEWTYNTLRDKSDNLYYDLIGTTFEQDPGGEGGNWVNPKDIPGNKVTGDGGIDAKKYSYNSGSMVSAGVALYKATNDSKYLNQAKATAASSRAYFGKKVDGFVVYPGSDGGTTYSWFDLILFKGYYDLCTVDKTAGTYLDEVQAFYDHNYNNYFKDGYMPASGVTGWSESGRNSFGYRVLMDHSTNAEVMLLLSEYKNLNLN